MYKYFTKRRVYIGLFTILYLMVSLTSLIHSFAFFGLANNTLKSVLLGCAFEIGQVAVLMSLLTSKKEQSRIMPWVLMSLLTIVQIVGNIFSSYKYMMLHSIADLKYFKEPIFIWTDLPDNITTVIVTYIVGAILPIICLCMCAMISNYITEYNDNIKEDKDHHNGINDKDKSFLFDLDDEASDDEASDEDNDIPDDDEIDKYLKYLNEIKSNDDKKYNSGFVNL